MFFDGTEKIDTLLNSKRTSIAELSDAEWLHSLALLTDSTKWIFSTVNFRKSTPLERAHAVTFGTFKPRCSSGSVKQNSKGMCILGRWIMQYFFRFSVWFSIRVESDFKTSAPSPRSSNFITFLLEADGQRYARATDRALQNAGRDHTIADYPRAW